MVGRRRHSSCCQLTSLVYTMGTCLATEGRGAQQGQDTVGACGHGVCRPASGAAQPRHAHHAAPADCRSPSKPHTAGSLGAGDAQRLLRLLHRVLKRVHRALRGTKRGSTIPSVSVAERTDRPAHNPHQKPAFLPALIPTGEDRRGVGVQTQAGARRPFEVAASTHNVEVKLVDPAAAGAARHHPAAHLIPGFAGKSVLAGAVGAAAHAPLPRGRWSHVDLLAGWGGGCWVAGPGESPTCWQHAASRSSRPGSARHGATGVERVRAWTASLSPTAP